MSLGLGIYFLTVLWFITLMLCWVTIRTGHYIGKISLIISSTISLVLLLLPSSGEQYVSANFYDRLFVTRYAILTFLLASIVLGSGYAFVYVCLTPIEVKKVTRRGRY